MTFQKLYSLTIITEDLNSRLPFLLKKYKNQTEESINQLAQADPTPNKKYIDWIIYNSAQFRIPEDINKIKETLIKFINLSRTSKWQGTKDLNSYKSYKELVQAIEKNTDITTAEPLTDEDWQDQHKIKEHGEYKLYRVTSAKAIMNIAKNTQWCVREEPYASDYLKKGPYFVIYKQYPQQIVYKNKEGQTTEYPSPGGSEHYAHPSPSPIILIHFPTAQIKDTYDEPIDFQTAREIYPLIQNSFKHAKFSYSEGIGDFEVFRDIATGSDKEVLEEYNKPAAAFTKLHNMSPAYRREKLGPDVISKLEDDIAKSPWITFKYLTNVISPKWTKSRNTKLEQVLVNKPIPDKTLESYISHLFDATFSYQFKKEDIPSHSNAGKLIKLLSFYYYEHFNNGIINNYSKKHNFPLKEIFFNIIKTTPKPNTPRLIEIKEYIEKMAQKYSKDINQLVETLKHNSSDRFYSI